MNQAQNLTRRGFVAAAAVGAASLTIQEIAGRKNNSIESSGLKLETVTSETFSKLRGTRFLIRGESLPGEEFQLVDVVEFAPVKSKARGLAPRSPFSVVFHGPIRSKLEQGTFQIEHESLGTFKLFMVPVGPMRNTHRLEAIFA